MSKKSTSELLGSDADYLLNHTCKTIAKESIHLPSSDIVDNVFVQSNRNTNVLRNLSAMFNNGRLAGTGFLSFGYELTEDIHAKLIPDIILIFSAWTVGESLNGFRWGRCYELYQ